jgi:hypothetical protein
MSRIIGDIPEPAFHGIYGVAEVLDEDFATAIPPPKVEVHGGPAFFRAARALPRVLQ